MYLYCCCNKDINECENKTICGNGECTNLIGTFSCSCFDGFQHSMDPPKLCIGKLYVFNLFHST